MTKEEFSKALADIKTEQQKIQSAHAKVIEIIQSLEAKYLESQTGNLAKNPEATAAVIKRAYDQNQEKKP